MNWLKFVAFDCLVIEFECEIHENPTAESNLAAQIDFDFTISVSIRLFLRSHPTETKPRRIWVNHI